MNGFQSLFPLSLSMEMWVEICVRHRMYLDVHINGSGDAKNVEKWYNLDSMASIL